MSTLFLIFRIICYVALGVVTLGVVGMLVLSNPEICSSFSTGSISCTSEGVEELAKLTMGILLVSAFTGVPVLLALLGLFFAIRAATPAMARTYRKIRPGPEGSEAQAEERSALQKVGRAGKVMAYILAAFFLSAVIAGIYEASFR